MRTNDFCRLIPIIFLCGTESVPHRVYNNNCREEDKCLWGANYQPLTAA